MVRFTFAVVLSCFSAVLWAVEVSSIVSCKAEGEGWLCAAYQNDKIHVFRSDFYQTKVEFKGALSVDKSMDPPVTAPVVDALVKVMNAPSEDGLPEGRYTVQLLACSALKCSERIQRLQGIPGSQVVEQKVQDRLMTVLVVGGYGSYKEAQRAAADIMTRYQIADKPWIRTVDSLRNNLISN